MKRDMDLVRELLLKLEAMPLRPGGIVYIKPDAEVLRVKGYDADQVAYHLALIDEAGWIDAGGSRPMVGISFRRLTGAGHDFLDAVRDRWLADPRSAAGQKHD